MSPRATVIVPSRGPAARLRRLLDSLARQTVPHETIVLDNASEDAEVSRACDDYDFVEAIALARNAGFSAPVNIGARRADQPALVLVNDDCVCDPEFVERIIAPLDASAGVVMAAGVMRDAGRPDLIDSAGMELDHTLLVYDYLNGEPLEVLSRRPPDPVGPSAAAAAFDRAAFLSVGGFDERLFAYWEDVDLVLRLVRAGGRCSLAPGALGTHEHSATLGSGSSAKNYLMGYGRGYLLRKWGVLDGRRIPDVLARELVLLGGQAVIDRNLAGLRGRVQGWRAASASEAFPEAVTSPSNDSLRGNLSRRFARRRRLAGRR